MTADVQLRVNYSNVITPSSAVGFFRGIPRWPSANDSFQFDLDYLVPVVLTALIPIIVAAVFSLFFVVHITIRYTCRQKAVDARILRTEESRRGTITAIAFAAVLTFLITIFIAISLISVTALNDSAADALDFINAIIVDVSRAGFAVVDVAIYVRKRLTEFQPGGGLESILSTSLGDFLRPALEAVQGYVVTKYPDVEPLRTSLESLVEAITDVLSVVRRAVNITSGVLLVIVLLLLSAPLLLFFVGAMPVVRRWRTCRILAHVLFLFFPALLAWVLLGVASGVGAAVSDVCVSVHEYREVLLGNLDASEVAGNALVDSNFTCPDGIDAGSLSSQLTSTVDSLSSNSLTGSALELLLKTSAKSVADTALWTRDETLKYVNCSELQRVSGKIEFVACGAEGHAAIRAIFDLWVAFLGLALSLSVALFSSLFGIRVMWSLLVWPRDAIPAPSSLHNSIAQDTAYAEPPEMGKTG